MTSRLTPFLLLAFVAFAMNSVAADAKRPNILLAFADDWGAQASAYARLSPGGINDVVSTPHFDKLAAEGVLFLNAHVNAPSCTPCRSSLLSGQHFWRTGRGAILQGAVWDPSIPSWPLLLKDAGYHIGMTHKVWSPGIPRDAPFGEQEHAYRPAGSKINQFSQTATNSVSKGMSVEEAKAALLEETRANFRAFLEAQAEGKPFAYWYGPTNVHRKWIKGSGKALWGVDPDSLKGKMPPFLPDVPAVREDLADYMGEAMAFDAQLGEHPYRRQWRPRPRRFPAWEVQPLSVRHACGPDDCRSWRPRWSRGGRLRLHPRPCPDVSGDRWRGDPRGHDRQVHLADAQVREGGSG